MQLPTTIHAPPSLDSFTPLTEHQSTTPSTFFSETPVLHYHGPNARALIATEHLSALPIFTSAQSSVEANAQAAANEDHGDATTQPEAQQVFPVDIYVSSSNLTLFSATTSTGVEIPYQSITLHAIQRLPDPSSDTEGATVQGLYMQLDLAPPNNDDEMVDPVELILLPPTESQATTEEPIKALFAAVSACSNLHPDAADSDEEMGDTDRIVFEGSVGYEGISGLPGVVSLPSDDGLPPPFPGSGGWITAENVGDFFTPEGEWIGREGDKEGEENADGKRENGRNEEENDQGAKRARVE
ncbi:hypothetical protein V494_05687 [Pseudogymnoascus sp. VKM F-4513 (FW-928)]|nr:hypothetical protein V494_05687 [Pseudogymnoascus sp. VKM F-4513 (FW-928)]